MLSNLQRWSQSRTYDRLGDENTIEKSQEVGRITGSRRRTWSDSTIIPWVSTVIFASLSLYLFLTRQRIPSLGSFEYGFKTELAASLPQISTESRWFTGTPKWTDDGVASLSFGPREPRYVGEPSQEIDDAWEDLVERRYFFLTEPEARAAWGEEYVEFWERNEGGYGAGLDVMHLLHCLNFVRKDFHRERYPPRTVDPTLHRYHCIDIIRQSLMCHADLTPIPTRYYKGLGQNYIDSNRPHVCRNWRQIRSWVTERNNGSLEVKPLHPDENGELKHHH